MWSPLHGRGKVGRPARTYLQQLCADTGCSLEELSGVIDDIDGWRKRVREIRASSATWSTLQLKAYYENEVFRLSPKIISTFSKRLYPIYPTPPLGQDMTQGQFLSGV